jgi:xanthine dehydrogenase accessory factor
MEIFNKIVEAQTLGKSVALCTITKSSGSTPRRQGSKMLVYQSGEIIGSVGGGEVESLVVANAISAMQTGTPILLPYSFTDPEKGDPGICGGQMDVYVDPINPPITIVIIGAGHVGKAVASLATWMGYRLIIWDDREEFAKKEDFPDAEMVLTGPIEKLVEKISINQHTQLILTTRNTGLDSHGIPEFLKTDAGYIGVIGSKRRWEVAKKKMIKNGVKKESLERVVSPIGLNIKGDTPEEIAISVIAEIIMVAKGGDASRKGVDNQKSD